MSETEKALEEEVERLTSRLQELESRDSQESSTVTGNQTSQTQTVSRAKPDTFSGTGTAFDDWFNHFELCASINGWTDTQSRQQLAVQLRGRAQRVYTSLQNQEIQSYESLVSALRRTFEPPQQRAIHKLAFRSRQRKKQESLVDLATDLRHLVTSAFPDHSGKMVEEELLEQFVNALDSRELRLGVSQTSPKNLDDALHTALKLETLFMVEKTKTSQQAQVVKQDVNMADTELQPQTTTEVNLAGSVSGAAGVPPRWATEIMERQNNIERLLSNSRDERRQAKPRRDECYNCGKSGHFQRNCPLRIPARRRENQGNGNRAGSYRW